ncbi:hypothetical protein JCM11491_001431 [Sporobolomyces phaffii]
MSASTTAQTIAVIGATGHQGGGVVDVLLSSSTYLVRAISSDPSTDKAKAFLAKHSKYVDSGRLTLVKGDLNDRASLETAIKGSYGLFASFLPIPTDGPIEQNPEVIQGKNLVDAVSSTGIEHFVYSSLPSIKKLSGGSNTKVFPFESKAVIEEYARRQFKNSTFVIPGTFLKNLVMPLWMKRKADGTVAVVTPVKAETKLGWIHEDHDMGTFVTAIFKKGPSVTAGKTYPINSRPVTSSELGQMYTRATGEPTVVEPLAIEEAAGFLESIAGKIFADALVGMLKHLDDKDSSSPFNYGRGYIPDERDLSFEDLGVQASTPEEYFKRTGWRVAPLDSATSA